MADQIPKRKDTKKKGSESMKKNKYMGIEERGTTENDDTGTKSKVRKHSIKQEKKQKEKYAKTRVSQQQQSDQPGEQGAIASTKDVTKKRRSFMSFFKRDKKRDFEVPLSGIGSLEGTREEQQRTEANMVMEQLAGSVADLGIERALHGCGANYSLKKPADEMARYEDKEGSNSSGSQEVYQYVDRHCFRCNILEPTINSEVYRIAIHNFVSSVQDSVFAKNVDIEKKYVPSNEDVRGEVAKRLGTLFVPCLVTNNVENAMNIVLDKVGVTREHTKIVVVFHPRILNDTNVPPSRNQVTPQVKDRCHLIVDVVFNRQTGDSFFDMLTKSAVDNIADYIMNIMT